jgi:hypothetical protein
LIVVDTAGLRLMVAVAAPAVIVTNVAEWVVAAKVGV